MQRSFSLKNAPTTSASVSKLVLFTLQWHKWKGSAGFWSKEYNLSAKCDCSISSTNRYELGMLNIMLNASSHWSDQTFFLQVNSLGHTERVSGLHFAPMMDKNTFVLALPMTRRSKSGMLSRKFCWKSTMSTKWVNILPVFLKVLWLAHSVLYYSFISAIFHCGKFFTCGLNNRIFIGEVTILCNNVKAGRWH